MGAFQQFLGEDGRGAECPASSMVPRGMLHGDGCSRVDVFPSVSSLLHGTRINVVVDHNNESCFGVFVLWSASFVHIGSLLNYRLPCTCRL